jgi:peptidyl-prolyl cis-trans isomerase C
MMRMQRTSLALVAAVALLAGCTKPAEDAAKPAATAAAGDAAKAASTVVATVNGQKLSSEVLDMFVQAVTSKPAAEATPEQKSQMLDQLINMALAAQAGEKEGVQNEADVKARIELLRMQILAEAATEKYIKAHPVSESEMKAEYDAQLANMPKEYKARHILVETKEKAEAIIKELAAGGDFAKIAGKESKDPGSGKNGGDLGWFSAQTMVKPFADAVAKLEKGQTTQAPVQSEFGWHVIQLEDTRSPEPPAFDDVKQQVEMFTQRKKLQTYLDDLRKNAKVQKSE